MPKEIVIDISAAGTAKLEANGFNGVGCGEATEQIEIALGGGAGKKATKKPEYFNPATTAVATS